MALNESQLAILNTLMYMEKGGKSCLQDNLWSTIWSTENWKGGQTLGDLLSGVTDEQLAELAAQTERNRGNDYLSGADCARIVQSIRGDETLSNLVCADMDTYTKDGAKSVCFLSDGEPYVVFKGTGSGEWPDNFFGGDSSGTPQQRAAVTYVDYIYARYGKEVNVSGHSKGANKAQYAAIKSDHVKSCVSFDGQGFSGDFIAANRDRIKDRQGLIKAYNHYKEPVSSLLFPIAGEIHYISGQSYGDGLTNYVGSHAMTSILVPAYDAEGKEVFVFGNETAQSALSREIQKLTSYLANTMNMQDAQVVFGLLAQLTAPGADKLAVLREEANADALGVLMAYLLEYEGYGRLIAAVLDELSEEEETAFQEMLNKWGIITGEIISLRILVILGLLLDFLGLIAESFDLGEYSWLMRVVESCRTARGRIVYVPSSAHGYSARNASSQVRDFTAAKQQELLAIIDQINAEPWYDPRKWDVWYRIEACAKRLKPQYYQESMSEYYRKVMDVNATAPGQIKAIFSKARARDARFASELKQLKSTANQIVQNAETLRLV